MEVVLVTGMFLSIWGSLGMGMYQLLARQHIPSEARPPVGFSIAWIIGGIITMFAVIYILRIKTEKREQQEKPKYELIQEPVYRKIE